MHTSAQRLAATPQSQTARIEAARLDALNTSLDRCVVLGLALQAATGVMPFANARLRAIGEGALADFLENRPVRAAREY